LSSSVVFKNVKIKTYRTIILPVILYGCETSSLTVREEHRLIVFENRVLRRIFGPKRDEVTGEWRRFLTRSFILCTPHQIIFGRSNHGDVRWAGHIAHMGERRFTYRVLVGIPEGRRPLDRPRYRWEDNIKMDH
jgi:hypothetical protein